MVVSVSALLSQSPVAGSQQVVERALELAGGGACQSVNHVRQTLIREGYPNVGNELRGSAINAQLAALIRENSTSRPIGEAAKR